MAGPASKEKPKGRDPIRDFIAELRQAPPANHVLSGMVKAADTDDGVLFAHVGGCERWIHIPASTIAAINPAGRVRCHSHSHAAAEIELKPPQTDLEKTLVNVAALHRAALERALVTTQGFGDDPHHCGPNAHWGQDQYGNWGCQPGR